MNLAPALLDDFLAFAAARPNAVPFFDRVFRPSFSAMASTTKFMTDVSCVTQCNLSRR